MDAAYLDFEFHKVFHGLHNYCVTDLSAFYLDILKDRLYASACASHARKSAQTALWHIVRLLLLDMAPVLSFTAEEIYQSLPQELRGPETTVFALQPMPLDGFLLDGKTREDWDFLIAVRGAANRAVEKLRQEGLTGHSLDSRVTIYADASAMQRLKGLNADLRAVFIVSQLLLEPLENAPADSARVPELEGVAIKVEKAHGEKCARCWIYTEELGQDAEYPDLCPRCAEVIKSL